MHGAIAEGGEHVVQFYDDDRDLGSAVAAHLAQGLRSGGVAIAIATGAHRTVFEAELERVGVDVPEAVGNGSLHLLDAGETLSRFASGGEIDRAAFHRVIGDLLDRAAARGRPVHLYGEMVALLWDEGDVLGAIELEHLWNEAGRERSFCLMCGYEGESVAGDPEAAREIRRLHSSVVPPRGSGRGGTPKPCVERTGELPPCPEAPLTARGLLAEALVECGHSKKLRDDAQLVLSELVTNAVIHARTRVSVFIHSDPAGVRLAVRDFDRRRPTHTERGPSTGLGMGLRLVESLAVDWGIQPTADGKTVWAELSR